MIKNGTVTINQRNLRVSAIEMYKTSQDKSSEFMKNLVEEIDTGYYTRSSYNVEEDDNGNTLCTKKSKNYHIQKSKTTSFGQQYFRRLGPKIQVPDKLNK